LRCFTLVRQVHIRVILTHQKDKGSMCHHFEIAVK
jgi:hypothetical protein